ncbi:hypothetical protein QAD02_004212 [Eretmocerus hayati]|uniref:Uncharacterized protein n=1 Tax=Eretmocerus hayati TaxID=131215 RepID=A0ACC2NP85_9HYME|nr:hypothetical protein QAD02_004212 [Eretmocerus hayati]
MGLKEFKIHFDNPYAAYTSGQTVTGRVVVVIDSPKKIRGIKLVIKGGADTHFTTSQRQHRNHEGNDVIESNTLTGHEEYFEASFYLIGSTSGREMILGPGIHTYTFTYSLPYNLPSSFESDFGCVRYTAKAVIDRPWKFDQESKVAFTVVSNFDLNLHQNALLPLNLEANKNFGCLCCASPPLSVNISLPVRGYVPGQTIPIRVNVENESGKRINTVKLTLQKVVTYSATTPRADTKVVELKVAEVSKGPVEGRQTVSYEQDLDVPPLPPSNLQNGRIIDFEYKLKVEACVEGAFSCNLRKSTTIYIGTVPLSSYQISQPPAPGIQPPLPQPSAPYKVNVGPTSNQYQDHAPPSYAEATFGGSRTLRDRNESEYVIGAGQRFLPKYPVYQF